MKIWLDDVRPAPEGWVWVTDVYALLTLIGTEGLPNIETISFDNDLGTGRLEGHEALSIIEETVMEQGVTKVPDLRPHTANPVARQRMKVIIRRIYEYVGR